MGFFFRRLALSLATCLASYAVVGAEFLCAGQGHVGGAAKPAGAGVVEGSRGAVALFARFLDEGADQDRAPLWAKDIFDASLPGSLSHFYETMSLGRLHIRGEAAARVYRSSRKASAYVAESKSTLGDYGEFSTEILRLADRDIDFSRFDNDGPDGLPDSGDDDGVVDMVFIVTASAPAGFFIDNATGIAHLGFSEPFVSDDVGAAGRPIRIDPNRGAVQLGRGFAEAVGSMAHEFGHILGLRDLYNVAYLREGGPPEEDSAGIGAWGLMGWGTLGWQGNDGPNSLSAWSRLQLGWAEVETAIEASQSLRLEDVGRNGALYRVLLPNREYFLLEYRRRESSYYDRHLPGEGLLVWHIAPRASVELVDLVCADGRWADAGFPVGRRPDPTGGDNLDYWSHDAAYTAAHAGNLGDSTDPFDGRRFTAVELSNAPRPGRVGDRWSARIDSIRLADGYALARIGAVPLAEVGKVEATNATGDGVLVEGEFGRIRVAVTDPGDLWDLPRWRGRLLSLDPQVNIQSSSHAEGTPIGHISRALITFRNFQVRLTGPFWGGRRVPLRLDIETQISGEWRLIWQHPFAVEAVALRQWIASVAIIDSLGNGDGVPQAGEFIRPALTLDVENPISLAGLEFSVRSLGREALAVGGEKLSFAGPNGVVRHSVRAPEFLVQSPLAEGTVLHFELQVESTTAAWRDTFAVGTAPGGDRTAPRVGTARVEEVEEGWAVMLEDSAVLEASPLRRVDALFYAAADTALVGEVSLVREDGGYQGVWRGEPGAYRMGVIAEDQHGNRGHGPLVDVELARRSRLAPAVLRQNAPNPFNAATTIPFTLYEAGPIQLQVYDLAGQQVVELASGGYETGRHAVHWDGRDRTGRAVASGVYFIRLRTADAMQTRKMVLLR